MPACRIYVIRCPDLLGRFGIRKVMLSITCFGQSSYSSCPSFWSWLVFLRGKRLSRRGPTALLRSRANRLFKPLVFGMVVVLPMDLYAWILGWVAEGLVPMVKLKSLKIDRPLGEDLWGTVTCGSCSTYFSTSLAIAGWTTASRRFAILQSLTARVCHDRLYPHLGRDHHSCVSTTDCMGFSACV